MKYGTRFLAALLLCAAGAAYAATPEELAEQAMAAYHQRDFTRSADLFAAAIAGGTDDAAAFYNGACAAALAGRDAQALDWLSRAIDLGGVGADHMQADADLASLHDDPAWPTLLAKSRAAQQQRERLWNSSALAAPYRETLSEDERVAGLSRVWSEAKFNFANFDLVPDLDWDALYLHYLPRVRAAATTIEYYRQLQSFVGCLRDGHSNVYLPAETDDAVYARPGLNTLYLEGRVIVRDVFDPRLSALGIAPGWEIVAVGGRPVAEHAQDQVMPYLSYSTEQDKLSRAYERLLLCGPAASSVQVDFLDEQGAAHALAVPRLTAAERVTLQPQMIPFTWEMLSGNVALVRLRSFNGNEAADGFEAHFADLAGADALILDLRENGGGNSGVGYRILATLTDQAFLTNAWHTREYRPAFRAWDRPERKWRSAPLRVPPHGTLRYDKPVAVLIGARTYSAAEDFAVAFDAMRRGRLVGEATGGSTGQPLSFPLPGGGSARICSKRDTYPDGKEFVGVGVMPHVVVRPTVEGFRAGVDTVLEAAVRLLRSPR